LLSGVGRGGSRPPATIGGAVTTGKVARTRLQLLLDDRGVAESAQPSHLESPRNGCRGGWTGAAAATHRTRHPTEAADRYVAGAFPVGTVRARRVTSSKRPLRSGAGWFDVRGAVRRPTAAIARRSLV